MNRYAARLLVLTAFFGLAQHSQGALDTNVMVAFTTTNSTPLNLGFAGMTTELLGTGIEYGDTNMQRYAAMLSPGWLLFPGGETADAFNWETGQTDTNWVSVIGARTPTTSQTSNLCANTVNALLGKGGLWFTNFASLCENVGGAKIIVCINGFTDTNPATAGAFAAYALSNHIHVSVWELCNEPYLFQGNTANPFFSNAFVYATAMKPYNDAIKAADPNAVVAVFFSDPARPGQTWNNDLGKYGNTNQYWDAVVYHHYPELPTNAAFADLMSMDNGVLFSNTTLFVTNVLVAKSRPNTTFLLTEMNACLGDGNGTQNLPTSSLYGGIWAAEYVMRVSTIPQMTFAGSYQLVNGSGVDTTNSFWNAVTKAGTNGYVTNTIGLPFGYFLSAEGSAQAVAFWALNRSTAVYPTTVGTNGPVVPMDTNGIGTMPAVYAQAYQGGNGKLYVLLTNKGSNAVPVQITQDGTALTNGFLETFVTSSDPSTVNSNPATNNVVIRSQLTNNPVMIPGYSVVRLEWTVFPVPPPRLSITATKAQQNLTWNGLTNIIYNVQGATNLPGNWATLGRVVNAQTNLSFTNWNQGLQQFYQLVVP